MKITLAVDDTPPLTFASPESAALHLLHVCYTHAPTTERDDRLHVLADRFTVLTSSRSWWRRALERYRLAEMDGQPDPVRAVQYDGFRAFRTPMEARVFLEHIEERLAGITAEMYEILEGETTTGWTSGGGVPA